MELLSDLLHRVCEELEDGTKEFLKEPYEYPQDIIDEVIDIVDRIDTLEKKLTDAGFCGSYRFA